MARILLTGSRGYIGSALRPALEGAGLQVREFDRLLGNDITDMDQVREAARDADLIVHLAALVGLAAGENEAELTRVNVGGTENVVSCTKPIILASALGHYGVDLVDEETPPLPAAAYYRTKLEAEKRMLPGNTVLRFGSLYGLSPAVRDDLLVHTLCRQAVKEGRVVISQSWQTRALTSIGDAVRAILFHIYPRPGIWNVVSRNISKEALGGLIQGATGCAIAHTDIEDKEKRDYFVLTDKIESQGFTFSPRLEEAIKEILAYYRGKEA